MPPPAPWDQRCATCCAESISAVGGVSRRAECFRIFHFTTLTVLMEILISAAISFVL